MRVRKQETAAETIELRMAMLRISDAVDKALERWPEVSALAWEAKSSQEFIAEVGALLGIDEDCAAAVADLQIRRIPREQRAEVHERVEELKAGIALLQATDPT